MATPFLGKLVFTGSTAALVALATLSSAVSAQADDGSRGNGDAGAAKDAGPPVPACVQVTSEARYVPFGYNHVVTLRNGCSRPASCTVSTDVNPKPGTTDVPSGQTVELVTYYVSPSQAFTASVNCALR
ncbi:hypothetical protein AKJ09_05283 [Labilithrix luteola]|uniref:Secreted protein n=1 Tax=Labilithrix luteola TaxID=1391654 RepID=A0A0K1PZP0_9BACT|nr:hypothetical protein [Labilithrix luteola]AKU98619.1 hypothetical protein AKJ09_05283 [Labilithrix luteola]